MWVSRCGVVATVSDGVLTKVTPDPAHPNGFICVKGTAAPEIVSAPDRLRYPMVRTRPKGDPDPGWGDRPAQAFIDAALDLAVGALRAAAGTSSRLDPHRNSLTAELKRYALAHLGDPGLSPATAARASFISVRQLHRLFAHEGVSFGAWLREQRLRRCRDDLTNPQLTHRAVSEIAARWGFRNAAYFTRAFHARYGTTPAELRSHATP